MTEQCTGADPLCPTDDVLNGVPCPDGDVCNGSETCVVGSCAPGTALDCDDGDACTADGCDALGGCFDDPIPGCGTAVPVATDLGRGLLVLAFAVVGLAALNVAARRRTTAG